MKALISSFFSGQGSHADQFAPASDYYATNHLPSLVCLKMTTQDRPNPNPNPKDRYRYCKWKLFGVP